tara:strand:+ start:275 stop:475 length:201 start_codon:yes stop_codon:yes gene_type:complete
LTDRASNNAFEFLREQLRKQMNELSDHISGGACKDFAEYRNCCGIIEGLAIAERELLDLQERIEKA